MIKFSCRFVRGGGNPFWPLAYLQYEDDLIDFDKSLVDNILDRGDSNTHPKTYDFMNNL